jgi:hypothetical protein
VRAHPPVQTVQLVVALQVGRFEDCAHISSIHRSDFTQVQREREFRIGGLGRR